MVDLSVCCSEHDVSMFFSEHGGTLLMSWRLWPEPRFVGYEHVDEDSLLGVKPCLHDCRIGRSYVLEYFLFFSDLGRLLLFQAGTLLKEDFHLSKGRINHSAWKLEAGPRPGGRDLEAGGRNPGPGRNSMIFFIGLREFHYGIKLLVEFGVGQRLVARVFKLSYRVCLDVLVLGRSHGCSCTLDSDGLEVDYQENHHAGPSKCSKGRIKLSLYDFLLLLYKDETLPPWWELVGVGRKQDISLHFLRLSGSMNREEECMGQDPGILRGRILARLRIRGMIRVELLDMLFVSAPGGWLQSMLGWPCVVLFWNMEDHGHVFPEGCMDFRPGTRRLDRLSSRNPEAGRNFVLELKCRMDFHPGTCRLERDGCVDLQEDLLVYLFDSKSPLSGRLYVFRYQNLGASSNASSSYPWEDLQTETDVLGMHHIPLSVDGLLVNFSQEIGGLSYGPGDSIAGSWDSTE
ncbi:hypothetical protein HID58_048321, partial [Brassica napus]